MTAVIAATPKFFFTSSTGAPLANGTVTVYLAGTTTPSDTWQDQSQGAVNTNPIELDARGAATIWLDSTLTYDFVVKNSADVTQYTIQDVQGVSAPTLAAVAVDRFSGTGAQTVFTLSTTPNGENSTQVYISGVYIQKNAYSVAGDQLTFAVAPANGTNNVEVNILTLVDYTSLQAFLDSIDILENLHFTQAGSGAVQRELQDKMRERLSPEDFGAVGDGVTDDTAALQLAIDTAKRVFLTHNATYKITSELTLTADGSGIIGDGSQTIYLAAADWDYTTVSNVPTAASNIVALKITNYPTITAINDILLRDFKIESEVSDPAGGRYVVGLWAGNVNNFKMERVEAFGFPASRVFQLDTVLGDSHVLDCYVHDCTTNRDDYAPNNPLIHCLTIDSSRINNTPSDGVKIVNFRVEDCIFGATAIAEYNEQSDGINLNGAGSDAANTYSRNHMVINPYIRNTGDCIDMFCKGATIIGGQLIDGYNDGIKVTTGARNNKIIGTHIVRPGLFGISFESAELPGFTQSVENNDVIGVTVEGVNNAGNWSHTGTFAFGTRLNGTPTFLPHNNRVIDCRVLGPTLGMSYAVSAQCGTGNVFQVENKQGYKVAHSQKSGADTTATIRIGNPSQVRAYIGSTQTVSAGSTETVEFGTKDFDSNDEFNAVAGGQIESITRSGTTATLTTVAAHGLATSDSVTIRNAFPSEYNGTYSITSTGADTFTYTMASDPGASASTLGTYFLNSTNYTFISTAHRRIEVNALVRLSGGGAGEYVLAVRKNGDTVASRSSQTSGSFSMDISTIIDCVPGTQVFIRFTNADSVDRDLTATSAASYLTINEIT